MRPKRKADGLTSHPVPDGIEVHDTASGRTWQLGPVTTLVWQRVDGDTAVDDLVAIVESQLGVADARTQVWAALDLLADEGLRENRVGPPMATRGFSRRELIRKA